MRVVYIILGAVLAGITYLFFGKSDIDPVKWKPPAPPNNKPNRKLRPTTRIPTGFGPEDVAVNSKGTLYTGLDDGRILTWCDGETPQPFINTGGRPLGIEITHDDHLIVCDPFKGLLKVAPDGHLTVLANEAKGIQYANNCDIAEDGTIYFSESSTKFRHDNWYGDLFEHRPHGRLHAYHPTTGDVELLMDGLYFANGVALAEDESFVVVAETWMYRIRRLWLKGDKAGQVDIFMENLPGMPDNISRGKDGIIWVALAQGPAIRKTIDDLAPHPTLRNAIYKLPDGLRPAPKPYARVLGVNQAGEVVHDLQDAIGDVYTTITGVREHDGVLYFGSIEEHAVGRVVLADALTER
jgi:sugar lactone lactonase YvrE